MGHHWPAHPVDPAALPGRAPVLLTGASPGLSVCELVLVIQLGTCLGCHLEE